MSAFSELPQLSPGAAGLLHIARRNDRNGTLIRGATLRQALGLIDRLFWEENKSDDEIQRDLLQASPPSTFLEFTAIVLNRIRKLTEEAFRSGNEDPDVVYATDFDRHVLHAMALTFADLAWVERSGDEFDGPTSKVTMQRLRAAGREQFYETYVRNYIGNVLQDYFARAGIRRNQKGIPADREVKLRDEDARQFVAIMRARAEKLGKRLNSIANVIEFMKRTWEGIV